MFSRVSANSLLIPASTPRKIPRNKRIASLVHIVTLASALDNLLANLRRSSRSRIFENRCVLCGLRQAIFMFELANAAKRDADIIYAPGYA